MSLREDKSYLKQGKWNKENPNIYIKVFNIVHVFIDTLSWELLIWSRINEESNITSYIMGMWPISLYPVTLNYWTMRKVNMTRMFWY
jgi:hypothetical protein